LRGHKSSNKALWVSWRGCSESYNWCVGPSCSSTMLSIWREHKNWVIKANYYMSWTLVTLEDIHKKAKATFNCVRTGEQGEPGMRGGVQMLPGG